MLYRLFWVHKDPLVRPFESMHTEHEGPATRASIRKYLTSKVRYSWTSATTLEGAMRAQGYTPKVEGVKE